MTRARSAAILAASTLVLGVRALPAPVPDFDPSLWEIRAAAHRVEEYAGETALLLDRGTAWLTGRDFGDGIIELDVAVPATQSFAGVVFHDDGADNQEHFYLRGHLSGMPDASQYNPIYNGVSGWQIYTGPRFTAPLELQADAWMHLRIVVSGSRASVQLDDQPPFHIPELLHGARSGRVGLRASGEPARFANVRVTDLDDPPLAGTAAEREPVSETVVRDWRVSEPLPGADLEGHFTLENAGLRQSSWSPLGVGHRGIANLAMSAGIQDGRDTVLAAVRIESDRERTLQVRFGFSDRVRVYLNGRLLFAGDDAYRTRDYRFLGTVGLHDELFLPLEAGVNELTFAVTEGFGGWGVVLDVSDRTGIRILP